MAPTNTHNNEGVVDVTKVLRFLNIVGCGIVQGTYTFEMFVVVSALNEAPPELSAKIHRALFKKLPDRYMPWFGTTGGLAALALLLFGGEKISPTARRLYAIGAPFWFSTSIILLGQSRPIDKQISAWVETSFPEEQYPAVRKKWDRLMYTRGPLGAIGYSSFVAAARS
jgi:hypothetical protein